MFGACTSKTLTLRVGVDGQEIDAVKRYSGHVPASMIQSQIDYLIVTESQGGGLVHDAQLPMITMS